MKHLILIALALTLTACPDKDKPWQGSFNPKHRTSTALGTPVVSADKIDGSLLPLIDEGLSKGRRIAKQYGYTKGLGAADVIVVLWKRSDECTNPAFLVRADGSEWDQTSYDKDKEKGKVLLCAAGLQTGNALVLAAAASHMVNISHFEFEHWAIQMNDPVKHQQTSGVHAHPINPDMESALRTDSIEAENAVLTIDGQKMNVMITK